MISQGKKLSKKDTLMSNHSQFDLQVHTLNELRYGLFPRLNERGSIEAGSLCLRQHNTCAFPRLNERGSALLKKSVWSTTSCISSRPASTTNRLF